ncbi:hypothetical protein K469DRAFT_55272 [Zopfia rhizophila CBS 207.26]|uniref:C2H2-type domain-containing protein n=1 Tax=Zopfia rhizophila CBS 207.26 TaxID=1314779 RepID=A0A6A6D8I6_9PEZI|nr:hypothetical protein K469DRAFT_55272 [Zopfia rhizophila CBS 207.26]
MFALSPRRARGQLTSERFDDYTGTSVHLGDERCPLKPQDLLKPSRFRSSSGFRRKPSLRNRPLLIPPKMDHSISTRSPIDAPNDDFSVFSDDIGKYSDEFGVRILVIDHVSKRTMSVKAKARYATTKSQKEQTAPLLDDKHDSVKIQPMRDRDVKTLAIRVKDRTQILASEESDCSTILSSEDPGSLSGADSMVQHDKHLLQENLSGYAKCPEGPGGRNAATYPASSPSHNANDSQSTSSGFSGGSSRSQGEHGAGKRPKNDSDDDDDDKARRTNKRGKDSGGDQPSVPRLACPIFLNNPAKFKHIAACSSGRGFENMSRVRQHMNRVHLEQSFSCQYCKAPMKSEEERAEHLNKRTNWICAPAPKRLPGLISKEQWKLINSKKKILPHNASEKDSHENDVANWNIVYNLLFPKDKSPPSPYRHPFTCSRSAELEAALHWGFDEVLNTFPHETKLLISEFREKVPEIVQKSMLRIGNGEHESRPTSQPDPSNLEIISESASSLNPTFHRMDLTHQNQPRDPVQGYQLSANIFHGLKYAGHKFTAGIGQGQYDSTPHDVFSRSAPQALSKQLNKAGGAAINTFNQVPQIGSARTSQQSWPRHPHTSDFSATRNAAQITPDFSLPVSSGSQTETTYTNPPTINLNRFNIGTEVPGYQAPSSRNRCNDTGQNFWNNEQFGHSANSWTEIGMFRESEMTGASPFGANVPAKPFSRSRNLGSRTGSHATSNMNPHAISPQRNWNPGAQAHAQYLPSARGNYSVRGTQLTEGSTSYSLGSALWNGATDPTLSASDAELYQPSNEGYTNSP